ncbi:MAG: SurA N-terminal domain-containing protein [Hyphomicrobiaceae bacterium]
MLEALRKSTSGILAKGLIALLVLSFAVWGIADVVTGVGRTTVATIGDTEIGANEFQREYQQQLEGFSAQFRRRLTPTQARSLGIEARILTTMIGSRAVDNHARELNLSITDKAVEESIRRDPLFKGPNGEFSPARLADLLYRGGYTEDYFIASRRTDIIRDQLTGAMLENVAVPEVLQDVYRTYRDQQRVVRYFTIDPKAAVKLAEPTPEQLKKVYDADKAKFMTPETRQLEVLMVTADDAKKKIEISDDELKEDYEKNKDGFSVPEKRKVLQMALKDAAAAAKARSEVLGGKSFKEVAAANGAKESDIDLGIVTQSQLIDPKIAEAAFKLEKDKVSDVVEGRFSTVLLLATEIQPGKTPSFTDVKERIRDRLASRKAPAEIRKLHDQVDDNRLAGKSLKEIGSLLGVTYNDIASIERNGNGQDGKPALSSPDSAKIISTAYDSSVGVENEVIELTDGGYAWVRVLGVTKPVLQPFDTIKDKVKDVWRRSETEKALTKLANEYVSKLKSGAAFEATAKAAGSEVKTTPAFKRGDSLPDLSRAAVTSAFAAGKNAPKSAATPDGKSRVVFEVTEIKAPANAKEAEKSALVEQIANELRTDVVAEYVIALRERLGVSINQRLLDQTVGIAPREGSY